MTTLTIPQDDPIEIVTQSDPTGDYDVSVRGASVVLTDRRADARDAEGRTLAQGRQAILTKSFGDESIYALSTGTGPAELAVEKTRFSIVRQPPIRQIQIETAITDSFGSGDSFDTSASATLPLTVDPSASVREVFFSIVSGEHNIKITTTGGDVFTVPVNSAGTIDSYQVDSFEISSTGSSSRIAGGWAGD